MSRRDFSLPYSTAQTGAFDPAPAGSTAETERLRAEWQAEIDADAVAHDDAIRERIERRVA